MNMRCYKLMNMRFLLGGCPVQQTDEHAVGGREEGRWERRLRLIDLIVKNSSIIINRKKLLPPRSPTSRP